MANKSFRGGPIIGQTELWIVCFVLGSSLLARSTWGADKEIIKAPPPQEKTEHTARAIFQASMEQPGLLGPSRRYNEQEYGIFKNTQKELLLSRFVLRSALRNDTINQLPIVKRQKDPVEWLRKNLSVTSPGKAEIMEVSFTTPEAKDAAAIVNAVAEAYLQNVVNVEQRQRRMRLDELDRVYQEATREVRNLRSKIRNMADRFGGAASEAFAVRQRLILDELSDDRRQLVQLELDLTHMQSELAAQKAVREADAEAAFKEEDPLLWRQEEWVKQQFASIKELEKIIGSQSNNEIVKKYLAAQKDAAKKANQRLQALRQEIHQKIRRELLRTKSETNLATKRLEASIEVVKNRRDLLAKEIRQLRNQAEQLSSTSVELEMYKSNLKNQEKTLEALTAEREKIRAELRAPSRIILLQKAEPAE